MAEPSSPERDRRLAAQHRGRPRWAEPVAEALDRVLDRSTRNRMRRYGKAVEVLRAQIPPQILEQVTIVDCKAGVLILSVRPGPLLAELSQHYAARVQAALVAAGTGITRLRFIPAAS